jgi:membrane protease YdiL (CAAX protease family)
MKRLACGSGLGARVRRRSPGAAAVAVASALLAAPAGTARAQAPANPSAVSPPAPSTSDPGGGARPVFSAAAAADPLVRAAAMPALAALQSAPAHALLGFVVWADVDARVRLAAAIAIGSTRNADLAPLVLAASERDPDPAVRAAAAIAHRALWPFGKSVRAATGLALLPGGGHFYLRRPEMGAGFLLSTLALVGAGEAMLSSGGEPGNLSDPDRDSDDPVGELALAAAQNVWLYSIFSAYREARLLRDDAGYRYPITRETLPELSLAPFNPAVLKSPWVWAAIPLLVGAAIGYSLLVSDLPTGIRHLDDGRGVNFLGRHYSTAPGVALGEAFLLGMFLPVGVGEEALFRGVFQSGLTESLGPNGGWIVASLIFGAVHIFNFVNFENQDWATAGKAVPFITLTGAYLGLVYKASDFQLRRGVALHFWYDFLLSTADFIIDPDHAPFVVRFGRPF